MKMKIFLSLFFLTFTTILLADLFPVSRNGTIIGYDKTKPPSLSLPAAYDSAISALGTETNQYHCISAEITTWFSTNGEWYFRFCSTNANSKPVLIAVEFNGKVVFDHGAH